MITRLRLDAALYDPAPPRTPGTMGRPRKAGQRLATLAKVVADAGTVWQPLHVEHWYGGGARDLLIASANDQASSRVLWGDQNKIFQRNGAAGGYGNAVNGYAGLALGQYHDLRGAYSQLRGLEAADHGLFGLDCWANGAATSSISASHAGQSQSCRTVLFATITSGDTGRLTADGNSPSGTNVANVDEGMARNMSLQLVARDVSTPANS